MKSAILELYRYKEIDQLTIAYEKITENPQNYDIKELAFPEEDKPLFQLCAYLLSRLQIDILIPYAFEMMSWFQDLNWPGVDIIENIVKRMPEDIVRNAYDRAKAEANRLSDEEWDLNLSYVFEDQRDSEDC